MKTALILTDGFDPFAFQLAYQPLQELQQSGAPLQLALCGLQASVPDQEGKPCAVTQIGGSLEGYDQLIVIGDAALSPDLTAWLQTASPSAQVLILGQAHWPERTVQQARSRREAMAAILQLTEQAQPPAPARPRVGRVERITRETQIRLQVDLDGSGQHAIETGVGFLDHMLTHIAVHGLFDLQVQAQGDLYIDPHHTMEDVGLALGQGFSQAWGDRAGLVRAASFHMPMDDTLAFAAVDLSGRPYAVVDVQWLSPAIGPIATTLFAHFFESFAFASRCNLHARVLYGKDDHHQAEALFKAFARALNAATRIEPRLAGKIPSTKGTLSV